MNKKENQTSKPELQFINSVHQIIIDYLDKKNDRIVNSVKKLDSIKSDVDFSINKPNDYKSIKKLIDQYLENAIEVEKIQL